ncbi:ABC transporter substrate-binding protein [Nocardioides sp. CER19]|uniref:ABC transporter substrate-binding protein n=1 Tax=Nocardioides sp. CER19 TaxID=3038538 RepID=UPI00244C524D|nr:ABC transporter substrate-binding protein [Nocardioides sp. CER19]MDH2416298.1 ABC transporter substrate-binding protein [Nocardioides sp. CER19]
MSKKLAARRALGTTLAVIVAVSLAACGSSGSSSSSAPSGAGEAASGGVYNLPLQAPQGAIDPFTVADYNSMFIVGLANAQLVNKDPKGKLVGQLASSWTSSKDGLSWTFELRPGAEFSDGKPVTPADVVWTFDQILAPKSTSPAASSFTGTLKSVAAASSGKAVVFTLAKPYSDFPYLLTGANTWILPANTSAEDWIEHPVGAGEFTIEKYTPGQGVTYKKNPHYWDASAIRLDGIEAKFFSDQQSQQLAFQSGEVDQLANTPESQIGSTQHRVDTSGWEKFDGLVFDVTKAPFDDVKVRQAIAWSLDREQIATSVYQNDAAVANDVATFPDYAVQPQGLTQREPDVDQAKQLLAGLSTPIKFTITTYTSEQNLAQAIQQQLDATGLFKVSLDVQSSGSYYASGDNSPWLSAPVTITDWADRLPSQLASLLYAKDSSWNASKYANPQLEGLVNQYDSTTDASARQDLADQIAQIEWNDVPVVITAFAKNVLLLSPKVKGDFANGQNFDGGFDFRGISVSH